MKTSPRRLTLILPAAAAAFALAGLARAETAPAAAEAAPQASVGVCVRWGADENKLAEVVVVDPSGDQTLDTAIPETLRAMPWKKPQGYTGEWVGLSVGVAGSKPTGKVPSCTTMAEDAVGPARPLTIGKLLKA